MLKIFSFVNDEFIRVKDFKQNEVILYSTFGQIFKPKCLKIEKITLVNSDFCFKDIPIEFSLGTNVQRGFLSQDRVIKAHSKRMVCSKVPRYLSLPYMAKTIVLYGNKSSLVDTVNIKYEKFEYFDDRYLQNFSHIDGLVNGVDIIGQMHNLSTVTENGAQWLVVSDENGTTEGFGYILIKIKDWLLGLTWYTVKLVLVIILVIFAGYILAKLLIFLIRHYIQVPKEERSDLCKCSLSNCKKNNKRLFSPEVKNPLHETVDVTGSENIPMVSIPCTSEGQVSDVYVTPKIVTSKVSHKLSLTSIMTEGFFRSSRSKSSPGETVSVGDLL